MKHKNIHYNFFQYTITRSKALIYLQDGIDILLESEGDFFSYLSDKYPKTAPFFNSFKEFSMSILDNFKESAESSINRIELNEKELKKFEKRIKNAVTQLKPEELERIFKPLINILESVQMIYDSPLYYDAIVTSVTAFETYLRDTLVDLISNNRKVENRFSQELQKDLNYEKIRYYDYDMENIMGYIVAEKISFYDLNEVDNGYRKIFGKTKGRFSIFESQNQKKRLRKFIKIRHLIVHNAGLVDQKFKKETRCRHPIDTVYPLTKKYVEDMIGSMLKVVNKIEKEIKNS